MQPCPGPLPLGSYRTRACVLVVCLIASWLYERSESFLSDDASFNRPIRRESLTIRLNRSSNRRTSAAGTYYCQTDLTANTTNEKHHHRHKSERHPTISQQSLQPQEY